MFFYEWPIQEPLAETPDVISSAIVKHNISENELT